MRQRRANFELFRILLMLGIVFGHACLWGGVQDGLAFPSVPYLSTTLLQKVSSLSVNCYVMLSGYFLCKSRFRPSRVIGLWTQVLFYSVSITLALGVASGGLSVRDALLSAFPVLTGRYWFATNYVALCLLCPFVNVALAGLSRERFRLLLATEMLLFSIPSMIPGAGAFNPEGGNGLIWFVVLYTIGAYLRLHPLPKKSMSRLVVEFACAVLLIFVLSEAVMLLASLVTGERQAGGRVGGYTSIFTVVACVLYFRLFERVDVRGRLADVVRRVSPLCFGVYLIHEHPAVRKLLWGAVGLGWAADRWWVALALVAQSVAVFCACALVEFGRAMLFSLIPDGFWSGVDGRFKTLLRDRFAGHE